MKKLIIFEKKLKKMGQNTPKHTPKIKFTIIFILWTYFYILYKNLKKLKFLKKKPKKIGQNTPMPRKWKNVIESKSNLGATHVITVLQAQLAGDGTYPLGEKFIVKM